ncbi:hypothetical protein MKY34_14465 [Sporosarcina sp. FSL K6-1522]|uniref:hypothetical protein n=1 Tax=Sporosarcina sp. FSL K6-1522 TaxID=2921554 RepID=UPI00315AE353
MEIGQRISFEIATGNVIIDTGEHRGLVVPTTIEQDWQSCTALNEREPSTISVIELEYGQYAQDFTECSGYRVDIETGKLVFSYPDPNKPEIEQPYQAPLSEQVSSNMDYLLDVDFRLMMVELGMY